MKQRIRADAPLLDFFSCFLLSAGLTVGSIFCPITAFNLTVNWNTLVGVLALVCLFTALLYRYRHAGLWILGLWSLILGAIFLWSRENLEQEARYVYTRLTSIYQAAYPFLQLPAWAPQGSRSATLLFALWGSALACINAWAIRRRQSAAPALLLDALPLALCLVVVDTPPENWCLLLLLAAACLLLLTQACRTRSLRGGSRLILGLALPVAALVWGLCVLIPPATYRRPPSPDQLLQTALNWAADFLPLELDGNGRLYLNWSGSGSSPQEVSLQVGPRNPDLRRVMEVLTEESGPVYLRGSAYGLYTGSSWDRLTDPDLTGCEDPAQGLLTGLTSPQTAHTLSIHTFTSQPEIYTTYYLNELPEQGEIQQDAWLQNAQQLRSYTITYYKLPVFSAEAFWFSSSSFPVDSADLLFSSSHTAYDSFVLESDVYDALPEGIRQTLLDIAQEAGLTAYPSEELPQAVADFVRDSARYDLDTSAMPEGADFVTWFLTQSDTGYCVHFASATVAMLRALGIPARFVTGYLVDAQAGVWTQVTGDNAHAWAEYYRAGTGWLPLEATPAGGLESTMGITATEPETQPGTEPETSRPSQTTAPTAASVPSEAPTSARPTGRLTIPSWIFWVLGLTGAFLLRRPVLLALRRRRLHKSSPNRQLLFWWRLTGRLARLLKQPLPEELEALALKARFSRHTISQEELAQIQRWEAELVQALRRAPIWKRLYARWILVLA